MKACAKVLVGLTLSVAAAAAFAGELVTAISVSTAASGSSGAVEIARAMPAYPVSAHKDGFHKGRVLIGYDVAADGTVQDVRVLDAFPVQVFTRGAINAVQKWRYMPGTTDKRMVEFTFQCD